MMHWRYPLAAFAGIALLSGCQQRQEPREKAVAAATEAAPTTPTLPLAEAPLGREDLVLAAMRAASNAALGAADKDSQRSLEGKRFALRLRFGCAGDDEHNRTRGWTFDEQRRKLSLRVEPDISGTNPLVRALGEQGVEAVEGFSIRRPWVLSAACPAPILPSPRATPLQSPENLSTQPATDNPAPRAAVTQIAIAQFFSEVDARTHRRDERAYAATKVLAEGARPNLTGYDLIISGRLRRLPSGSVIACINRDAEIPPDCIVSVEVDTVAIEDPSSGERLAEWSGA